MLRVFIAFIYNSRIRQQPAPQAVEHAASALWTEYISSQSKTDVTDRDWTRGAEPVKLNTLLSVLCEHGL